MFTIETERCLLRPFTEEDAPDLFEMERDPLVHQYLGKKPFKHIDQVLSYIHSILDQYANKGIGRMAVIEKNSQELLGWSGLKYESNIRPYTYIDIGYRLKVSAWGKGIATETAEASVNYGINRLLFDKICGAADVDNIGSNRVLTKIGMNITEQFDFNGVLHNWYEIEK